MKQAENEPNFKQAFCTYFKCRPEEYLKRALFYSFFRHSVTVAQILCRFRPISIRLAQQAIETLGKARDRDEVVWVMNDYRYQLKINRVNFLVDLLRIRISGRRVLDLYDKLLPLLGAPAFQERAPQDTPAA